MTMAMGRARAAQAKINMEKQQGAGGRDPHRPALAPPLLPPAFARVRPRHAVHTEPRTTLSSDIPRRRRSSVGRTRCWDPAGACHVLMSPRAVQDRVFRPHQSFYRKVTAWFGCVGAMAKRAVLHSLIAAQSCYRMHAPLTWGCDLALCLAAISSSLGAPLLSVTIIFRSLPRCPFPICCFCCLLERSPAVQSDLCASMRQSDA